MAHIGTAAVGLVLTANGAGISPSFQTYTPQTLLAWTNQSGNFNAASNNGYIATAALTATLPASPSNGDLVAVIVDTTGSVVIAANLLQFIRIDGNVSLVVGTATSTARGNAVTLVYNSSDLTWIAQSFVTAWTVV